MRSDDSEGNRTCTGGTQLAPGDFDRQTEQKMSELRRKDRALTDEEARAVLDKAEYGVLSTVADDGTPYGVPLNFCVIDECLYFHCAVEGQKIANITQNTSVSFCAVGHTELLPDKFGTKYESVIVSGEVEEVVDLDKQIGLEGLLRKYSAGFLDRGMKYIESQTAKTRVFRIPLSHLTGKARR